jgi:hypothetical protein
MKTILHILAVCTLLSSTFFFSACSTPGVGDARTSGVERRQDRIDARTSARQERWRVRGEREDARADARFDSW